MGGWVSGRVGIVVIAVVGGLCCVGLGWFGSVWFGCGGGGHMHVNLQEFKTGTVQGGERLKLAMHSWVSNSHKSKDWDVGEMNGLMGEWVVGHGLGMMVGWVVCVGVGGGGVWGCGLVDG